MIKILYKKLREQGMKAESALNYANALVENGKVMETKRGKVFYAPGKGGRGITLN